MAERGNQWAIDRLEGPDYPEVVEYLYGWAMELHAARRVGMNGWERITYGDMADWARLTGRDPQPREVAALLRLTDTMIHPPEITDG